jgi:tRNA (cmo5U34)-methyltransferase
MDSGDNILTSKGNFSFAGNVPKNFDQHVRKSVPLYDMGHDVICKLSSFFLSESSNVYDLRCSTGTLIQKIDNYNPIKKINFFGIDVEKTMLHIAKKKTKKIQK